MAFNRFVPVFLLLLLSACGGSVPDEARPAQATMQGTRAQVSTAPRTAADYSELVQQIYVAYFGRPADAGGLIWHENALLAAGAPTDMISVWRAYSTNPALKSHIDSFGRSQESADLYPGNNDQFISAVYRNLFSREADEAGKAYWVGMLDAGTITRANAAITLVAGAQSTDITVINNKTQVASNFTSSILTPVQNKGYDGLAANVVVRKMLGSVGISTDLAAFNTTIKSTIAGLAAGVAASNGWELPASVPAMNSVSAKDVTVAPNPIVIPPLDSSSNPSAPTNLAATPAGTNLKLWIYDPRNPSAPFIGAGIFLQNKTTNSSFDYMQAGRDGSLFLQLSPGTYQFDTTEPGGMAALFLRRRFQVAVDSSGVASVTGSTADSRGFHAVSLELASPPASPQAQQLRDNLTALANQPAQTFQPTSLCQLMDQVTPNRSLWTDLSAGFPKVRVRLQSHGNIRALIVPVEFTDVAGRDNPPAFFTPIATNVRDFYLKQSYGRVTFDFEILPTWVSLPFPTSKYGFGAVVDSGDFNNYRNDIVRLTDKLIDYSKYDAVYFVVPQQMPMAKMGWGPAITFPTWSSTGYVTNGAMGGADMYFTEANGIVGGTWKWMAHETGHAFGLYDEDFRHASATLGNWSIMAQAWSNNAIEFNGWDRYLQGWLGDSQVSCLAKTALNSSGTTVVLSPLVRQSTDTKVAMVPLSSSKILVIESRKNEGLDRIAPGREGVLVYTVDMTIGQQGGGYRTQRRPGSSDVNFEDAALRVGDAVTVDGVVVTVVGSGVNGDTVKISSQ